MSKLQNQTVRAYVEELLDEKQTFHSQYSINHFLKY